MRTITKAEAQSWVKWTIEIQTRTERLRAEYNYMDALTANVAASLMLNEMLQAFVAPAEVQTQPELEFAQ